MLLVDIINTRASNWALDSGGTAFGLAVKVGVKGCSRELKG